MKSVWKRSTLLSGGEFVFLLLFGLAGRASGQTWTKLNPIGAPPDARMQHSSVYNGATNRMIIFGGSNAPQTVFVPPSIALRNDLWVLADADGSEASLPEWIQLFPTGGTPSRRAEHPAAYDPGTNRMIVFGGNPNVGSCFATVNDLWLLENADGLDMATGLPATPNWTQLSPTGRPPSPRGNHAAAYDAATNRMILFGGNQACGPQLSEVWLLENANGLDSTTGLPATPDWLQVFPTGGPPLAPDASHATYDPIDKRLIVAGSTSGASGLNQLWVLRNANGVDLTTGLPVTPNWVQLFPTGGLPTAELTNAVYDPTTGRVVIFGGINGPDPGGRLNEVWALDNANGLGGSPDWTQLFPAPDPVTALLPIRRDEHRAVFNPVTDRMIVFGGRGCAAGTACSFRTFNDVWVLADANGAAPNGSPVALCQAATLDAGASCLGAVTPAQVDGGSSDPEDGANVTLSLDPTGPFGLGDSLVTLTVTDSQDAQDSCMAQVTVTDSTAPGPMAFSPPDASADAGCQARVPSVEATAVDNCDPDPALSQTPLAGTLVDLGVTPIAVIATDSSGNAAATSVNFQVLDTTGPAISVELSFVDADEDSDSDSDSNDEDSDRKRQIHFSATDNCEAPVQVSAVLDLGCTSIPVQSGQVIQLNCHGRKCRIKTKKHGIVQIQSGKASLVVSAIDAAGNSSRVERLLCPGL